MKSKIYDSLKFLIGWPLSILAFIFIFKLITPQASGLISRVNEISTPSLFASIFCFLIYYFIRGYIWKKMLKQGGYKISFKDANFIWAASEIKRYIPGNIWSFLGRAVMFEEKGIDKKVIAKYSFVEMQLLILGSVIVALFSLPFISKYYELPQYFNIITPVIVVIVILFYVFHKKIKLKHFFLPNLGPLKTLNLLFLNVLMFLAFGFGYFFTFISFVPIDFNLTFQLVGFSVFSFIVGYLSLLTPSGFGVREGALIFGLNKIMPTGEAGFLALFSRFILIVAELIFVLVSYIWYKKF